MLRYKIVDILLVAFSEVLIFLPIRLVEQTPTLVTPHVYMKSAVVWISRVPLLKGDIADVVKLAALATPVFFAKWRNLSGG